MRRPGLLTAAALARMREYGERIRHGDRAKQELPFVQEAINEAHEQAVLKICSLIDRGLEDRNIVRAALELRAVRGLADRFRIAIESAAVAKRESHEAQGG